MPAVELPDICTERTIDLEVLTGWWDDYLWGAVIVAKVFAASLLSDGPVRAAIGAGAKLSDSRVAQKIAGWLHGHFPGHARDPRHPAAVLSVPRSLLTAIAKLFDPDVSDLSMCHPSGRARSPSR